MCLSEKCFVRSYTEYLHCLGVSIVEVDDSGITMELEMQWDGNPNIVLDVQTYLGVALPIQVSFILFFTLLFF